MSELDMERLLIMKLLNDEAVKYQKYAESADPVTAGRAQAAASVIFILSGQIALRMGKEAA